MRLSALWSFNSYELTVLTFLSFQLISSIAALIVRFLNPQIPSAASNLCTIGIYIVHCKQSNINIGCLAQPFDHLTSKLCKQFATKLAWAVDLVFIYNFAVHVLNFSSIYSTKYPLTLHKFYFVISPCNTSAFKPWMSQKLLLSFVSIFLTTTSSLIVLLIGTQRTTSLWCVFIVV